MMFDVIFPRSVLVIGTRSLGNISAAAPPDVVMRPAKAAPTGKGWTRSRGGSAFGIAPGRATEHMTWIISKGSCWQWQQRESSTARFKGGMLPHDDGILDFNSLNTSIFRCALCLGTVEPK